MYQVLARKWRPQSFDELVGQRQVSRTLSNAIKSDRLAHAYVFAGLRGTGKTTVARILAKCLNCEKGPGTTPCDACAACQEVAESRSMDVLEIDAASRTKVEQTRELMEMVSYAPVRDRYKILIIDEAHMLSKASFNALLKTLEEPPPNVIFVLATTELQKILPTILSRCQVFEFRRVTAGELTTHLRKICDEEKIEISDAALERLARAGEGSVRDSLSQLERVLAFCGQKVEDDDVLRILGAVRVTVLADLLSALGRRDAGAMLDVLDGLVDEGHDLVHFWGELIAALRDLLLLHALPERSDLLARSAEEAETLSTAAEGLSNEDLTRAFQLLADLEHGLKTSSQPRYLFEALLIRLASLGAVRPIEEVLSSLASHEPASAPRVTKAPVQKKKAAEPTRPPAPTPAPLPAPSGDVSRDFVNAVRGVRPMVGAMLEQAASITLDAGRLHIRLPAAMEAVKRQLDRRESAALLKQEAERLSGDAMMVQVALDATVAAPKPDAPAATTHPAPPVASGEAPERPAGSGLLDTARREPGVRNLLDTFGATVVDIKPLDGPEGTPD